MRPLQSSVFLLIATMGSCQKDEPLILESPALLEWRGAYDIDGCGFFVNIDSIEYKPENESFIDESFKTSEDVEVIVRYEKAGKNSNSFCQWGVPQINESITIVSLKRK